MESRLKWKVIPTIFHVFLIIIICRAESLEKSGISDRVNNILKLDCLTKYHCETKSSSNSGVLAGLISHLRKETGISAENTRKGKSLDDGKRIRSRGARSYESDGKGENVFYPEVPTFFNGWQTFLLNTGIAAVKNVSDPEPPTREGKCLSAYSKCPYSIEQMESIFGNLDEKEFKSDSEDDGFNHKAGFFSMLKDLNPFRASAQKVEFTLGGKSNKKPLFTLGWDKSDRTTKKPENEFPKVIYVTEAPEKGHDSKEYVDDSEEMMGKESAEQTSSSEEGEDASRETNKKKAVPKKKPAVDKKKPSLFKLPIKTKKPVKGFSKPGSDLEEVEFDEIGQESEESSAQEATPIVKPFKPPPIKVAKPVQADTGAVETGGMGFDDIAVPVKPNFSIPRRPITPAPSYTPPKPKQSLDEAVGQFISSAKVPVYQLKTPFSAKLQNKFFPFQFDDSSVEAVYSREVSGMPSTEEYSGASSSSSEGGSALQEMINNQIKIRRQQVFQQLQQQFLKQQQQKQLQQPQQVPQQQPYLYVPSTQHYQNLQQQQQMHQLQMRTQQQQPMQYHYQPPTQVSYPQGIPGQIPYQPSSPYSYQYHQQPYYVR